MLAPPFAPTGVGSLPFDAPEAALAHVASAYPEAPFVPELPRSPGEPGFVAGLWPEAFEPHADAAGKTTLAADLQDVKDWLEAGAARAPRVRVAVERLRATLASVDAETVAVHLPGPVTLLRATRARAEGDLWAQPRLRVPAAAFVAEAAAILADVARTEGRRALVVLDEPALVAPAVDVDNPANLQLFASILEAIARAGGVAGLHSCAAPPIDLLPHLDFECVHVDARAFAPELLRRRGTLERFVRRGASLALGIFDARDAADDVTAAADLVRSLPTRDGAGILLSAACGLPAATAERAADLAAALRAVRERLLGGRA